MNLSDEQKKCLLNVLNVLAHISNGHYVVYCWNSKMMELLYSGSLPNDHLCNTIVINCRESLNILEDNYFYDLIEPDFGNWVEFIGLLNKNTFDSLIAVCEDILSFIDNSDMDLDGNQLMEDPYWLKIMSSSKIAFENLRNNIDVDEIDYLW